MFERAQYLSEIRSDRLRKKEERLKRAEGFLGEGKYYHGFRMIVSSSRALESLSKYEPEGEGKEACQREAASLRLRAARLAFDRLDKTKTGDERLPEAAEVIDGIDERVRERFRQISKQAMEAAAGGQTESPGKPRHKDVILPGDGLYVEGRSHKVGYKPRDESTRWWYRALNQLIEARITLLQLPKNDRNRGLFAEYKTQRRRLDDDYLEKRLRLTSRMPHQRRVRSLKDGYVMEMLELVPDETPDLTSHKPKKKIRH